MRRAVLALSAAAVLGGLALSASAQTLPVGAQVDTKDGVVVATTVEGQPAAGATVRDGRACAGVGEQMPVCQGAPVG